MMDPKILHKVMPFDGQRASWKTFGFQCRTYLIAQGRRYRRLLEKCEDGAQDVDNVNLSAQEEELSTQLYFALALVMPEGSAGEMIVGDSSSGEGAAPLRKPQKEYNPNEAGSVLAMWTKLKGTKFEANDDAMVSISKLDEDMTRCQNMSGWPVSDLIERGILTEALKEHDELQKHVFRICCRLNMRELLRAEVASAPAAERAVDDDPMGIGGLKGGKKLRRGRGEGKGGKGKEGPPNSDADLAHKKGHRRYCRKKGLRTREECKCCRKRGRRSANCRERVAKEKQAAACNDNTDKKQHRNEQVKGKKRVAGGAVKELERLRRAGVAPATGSTAPTQPLLGAHSSADSAATLPVCRGMQAKMILALRARDHRIDWKCTLPSYEKYTRSSRKKLLEGRTWHCREWNVDFCETCAEYCLDKHESRSSISGECSCCESAAVEPALPAAVGGLRGQVPEDDRLRLAPLRNAIALDSGAQVSAAPRKQEPAGEKQVPKVVFDIFYVGTDQLAARHKLKGGRFSCEKPLVTKADLEQAISVLNAIACEILAQGPAAMALANAVRDRRSRSTLVRVSPPLSLQSAGCAEGANELAAGLPRTSYKLKLKRKLGRDIEMTDPIAPWLVMPEYTWEISEMGEQVGAARRMPEEFRWQPELTQNIRATPWKHILDKSAGPIGRSMYTTQRTINARGPTGDGRTCSAGYGSHSAACRRRFETIQAELLREKKEKDPVAPDQRLRRRCQPLLRAPPRLEQRLEQIEQMVEVSAELQEHDQWGPKTAHYENYTAEPLDEDLYQKGRDDQLLAMKDYGVYVEEGGVRWRFVATEINKHEVREENHQGTPPLMIARETLSQAASSPTSTGEHKRMIHVWDVRKAFFNVCLPGRCWRLLTAMNGNRKASQMWGEVVRTTMGDGHWGCFTATPDVFYSPASSNVPAVGEDSAALCHGDDFLAEGYDEQLDELDELLRQQFEVTASARLGP
ncbi:unnamed protein product [Prorocentrum cordatum]|uniref:RNA-directed RNA polymerase n=1 Tax=Prorocentrum cordatum TaxID=2364126 RepID=A0ABN9SJM1_9DINO|nr:unnamed protein product [Polarella glacialis]